MSKFTETLAGVVVNIAFWGGLCWYFDIHKKVISLVPENVVNFSADRVPLVDDYVRNKVCSVEDYRSAKFDYENAVTTFKAVHGSVKQEFLNKILVNRREVIARIEYDRAVKDISYCRGEIDFKSIADNCDLGASPTYGPIRKPRVRDITDISPAVYCSLAVKYSASDSILLMEFARTAVVFMDKLNICIIASLCSVDDPFASPNKSYYEYITNVMAYSSHPYAKSFLCIETLRRRFGNEPNPNDYKLAEQRGKQAWDQAEDARGAACVGALYESGLGVSRDLRTALVWFEKAESAGLSNAQYIAHLKDKIATEARQNGTAQVTKPGFTDTEVAVGVGVSIAGAACLLFFQDCRDFAWEAAKEAAADAAAKAVRDRLLEKK